MITSYDISDRSPEYESPERRIIPHKDMQVPPLSEEQAEYIRVQHKVATSFGGVTSSVLMEAVDSGGNVIRAESFRLPTVSSRVALTSRLHAFEQSLIQDGYQVAAD
ncbi:hypothetical protein N6H13_07440 [Paenibacillus sp. CC-CFT742]|nr:hypothetical protein [Paenibacillus sp. CC-CFT742]WJH30469.1 hypothetical protein N6H13_07440 [Paenibacillus sp. CC-CFT742]